MKIKTIIGLLALMLALTITAQPQAQQQTVRIAIRNAGTQQITALDANVSGCMANLTRPTTTSLNAGDSVTAVVQAPSNCQPQIMLSYQTASGNNCRVTIKPALARRGFGSQSASTCQASVIPMPGSMTNELGFTVILR